MNLFQLILKQMRQRALGTWLTLLSVLLGVALAVSILLMRGAGASLFGQTEYGYDVLVGIGKGSPLQLTLNTVYHIDVSPGNIPYWVYETLDMQERPPRGSKEFNYNSHVRTAVPIAVGDTYKGRPIIGTPPKMFVSLSGLREQIDAVRSKQTALRKVASKDAAAQQAALNGDLKKLKEEVTRVARESTPLIEPADPSLGEDKKWHYGKPASLRADEALAESDAAAAALALGGAAEAAKHQDAVVKDLDVLFKAAGAENGPLEYRPGKSYEVDQGRIYQAWKFEAVIGSEVAKSTGLQVGSKFQATHGNPLPRETPDIHPEKWEVVGVLKPTHTSADRCLFIPLVSFYTIAEHEKGLKGAERARQGQATTGGPQSAATTTTSRNTSWPSATSWIPALPHEQTFINVDAPKNTWEISAILIKSRGGVTADDLIYFIKNGGLPGGAGDQPRERDARVLQHLPEQLGDHPAADRAAGQRCGGGRHPGQHLQFRLRAQPRDRDPAGTGCNTHAHPGPDLCRSRADRLGRGDPRTGRRALAGGGRIHLHGSGARPRVQLGQRGDERSAVSSVGGGDCGAGRAGAGAEGVPHAGRDEPGGGVEMWNRCPRRTVGVREG